MEIVNKQAYREFTILEEYTAGIKLLGPEVKSVKNNRLILQGSYVKFINKELYLINAEIPLYRFARIDGYDPQRTRKLLLKKTELVRLTAKIKQHPGLTIVPLKCYNKGNLLKLQIALSKGKKGHEIKAVEKTRELKRKDQSMLKEFLKK
jgi:SsrA-binding protein